MYAIDYLGGANYGALILKKHPRGFGAGFILNTNKPHWPKTNAWPIIEKLAASGKCPLVKVHAQWEDNHQYQPRKHDKIIMTELDRCNAMAVKFPHVRWLFSFFCELDTTGQSVDVLYSRLHARKASNVELVNSVSKGAYRDDAINEFHGTKGAPSRGPFTYSWDGTQCMDTDVQGIKTKYLKAQALFFWASHMNGKWSDDPKKDGTPRDKRKCWPYGELIDSFAAYADDASLASLDKRHIWKPHADQHGPERQPREGKPVFITPVNAKEVQLIAANGAVIAKLPRKGNYTDGRPLYRGALFGYQYANRARKACGSSLVRLVANGKEIGTIHPAFRAGAFR